jgi:hypothetical protein
VALPPGSLFIADTATAPLRLLPESLLPAYLKPLRLQLRDKSVPTATLVTVHSYTHAIRVYFTR